jgi:23S rRNA pseudouridine1911/1915/1917 synthase
MDLDILYEDEDLIVLNKPPGLVVHPAPGNYSGTLVHGLLWHKKSLSSAGGASRMGIVHRLDKNTSGLMMIAKNDGAHARLTAMLSSKSVYKEYRVLCWGAWDPACESIDVPIMRHRIHRQKMAADPEGREALTKIQVLQFIDWATYLKVVLATGRTHQIRVHLRHRGFPVVGDEVYGGRTLALKRVEPLYRGRAQKVLKNLTRQFIHAKKLEFRHPNTGKKMCFECGLAPDLRAICELEGINHEN